MRIHFFIGICVIFLSCKESKKTILEFENTKNLKSHLQKIYQRDQGIREIINGGLSDKRKHELIKALGLKKQDIEGNKRFSLMRKYDSLNLIEVEKIIKAHGYPSKKIVGEPANMAIYYVVQHSNKIDVYLPIIQKAAKNGDISMVALAMMEDRNLMNKGEEQIYGTQIKGEENKKGTWIYYLWPVRNIDSINTWRKNVGFKQTIEEYLKDMEIEKKFYKLSDLKKL